MDDNELDTSSQKRKNKKHFWILIGILQFAVLLYSLTGVVAKFASRYELFSLPFILLYALEIFILMIYAIVWQQVVKRMSLSVAYANKALTFLWALVWSLLIFSETVSVKNIIGVVIVVVGTAIVNIKK